MIDEGIIRTAIRELGIENNCICIHSSLKSFKRQIKGDAETIISAFLEEKCTVIVPAFGDDCEIYPPKHLRPERNGTDDYSYFESKQYGPPKIFTIESNDIAKEDMGLLPYTLINMKTRKRGYHPLNSMAALGNSAIELVSGQSADDVWTPFKKLCELNGFVLLMGVYLYRATIIHYAEQLAGRSPFVRWAHNFVRWAHNKDGIPSTCNTGGCSHGYENFAEALRPIEKTILVGDSIWRCFPAKEMVDICVKTIQKTPSITHCHNPNCGRCNDAILGGPIWKK